MYDIKALYEAQSVAHAVQLLLQLPALLGALKTLGNGGVMSIAFKNPIGLIVLLVIAVLAIGILVTVAWVAGLVTAVVRLWQAFREDRAMGTPFRPHFPAAGRSRPKAGSTAAGTPAPPAAAAGTGTTGTATAGTTEPPAPAKRSSPAGQWPAGLLSFSSRGMAWCASVPEEVVSRSMPAAAPLTASPLPRRAERPGSQRCGSGVPSVRQCGRRWW